MGNYSLHCMHQLKKKLSTVFSADFPSIIYHIFKYICEYIASPIFKMSFSIINGVTLLLMTSFEIYVVSCQSMMTIHLPKCCDSGEEYVIGMDNCRKMPDDINPQEINPEVYSVQTSTAFERGAFNLTFNNKIPCQDGFVANISMDFQLFENGSLLILFNGIIIPVNKFCVDHYQTFSYPENPTNLVARYCAPDPCIGGHCIRKCCPVGMVLNEPDNFCQNATENVGPLQLRDEFGVSILLKSGLNQGLAILEAAFPMCQHETIYLVPDSSFCFSIIPNGTLFVPLFADGQKFSDHYCVDNLVGDNGYRSVMGIVCVPSAEPSGETVEDVSWLISAYPYIFYISSTFLIATFIVYAIIPELRNNVHGISIMCQVASLAVMYIGLGTIQNNLDISDGACISLATVTHFAYLSSFTWLTVMSFDIWWTFSKLRPADGRTAGSNKIRGGRRLKFYFIYALTFPFIIVLAGIIADNAAQEPVKKCWFDSEEERQNYLSSRPVEIIRPHFGEMRCWFSSGIAPGIAYVYGPICFSSIANIFFFASTAIALRQTNKDAALAAASKTQANKQKFRVILSIFILMGLTLVFQFVAVDLPSFANRGALTAFGIIVDFFCIVINAVLIFILFVCKKTVWNRLQLKFPILKRLDVLICSSCVSTYTKIKRRCFRVTPLQGKTADTALIQPTSSSFEMVTQDTDTVSSINDPEGHPVEIQ